MTKGKVFKGVIRINKRNHQDAYVTIKGMPDDIYIAGSKNRNRALEGDVVAVVLLEGLELAMEQSRRNDKQDQRKLDDLDRLKKCQLPGHLVSEESLMLNDDDDVDTPLTEERGKEYSISRWTGGPRFTAYPTHSLIHIPSSY